MKADPEDGLILALRNNLLAGPAPPVIALCFREPDAELCKQVEVLVKDSGAAGPRAGGGGGATEAAAGGGGGGLAIQAMREEAMSGRCERDWSAQESTLKLRVSWLEVFKKESKSKFCRTSVFSIVEKSRLKDWSGC